MFEIWKLDTKLELSLKKIHSRYEVYTCINDFKICNVTRHKAKTFTKNIQRRYELFIGSNDFKMCNIMLGIFYTTFPQKTKEWG